MNLAEAIERQKEIVEGLEQELDRPDTPGFFSEEVIIARAERDFIGWVAGQQRKALRECYLEVASCADDFMLRGKFGIGRKLRRIARKMKAALDEGRSS